MKKITLTYLIGILLVTACNRNPNNAEVEQWDVFEVVLQGPATGNPYMDTELVALFSQEENTMKVPGFYDGNGIYRIRFSPPASGQWKYETESNENELSGKKGKFTCIPATGINHGPVTIVNKFYLEYSDGSPYYATGTTAYQWTSVKQEIQGKTLQTLASSPFNKIRMCIFPKHYRYGNDTEPWSYPFQREGLQNDFSQPNYEFFRQVMEQAPVKDMIPFLIDNNEPENINNNIYILSKSGEYYLAYTAEADQPVEIDLTGKQNYKVEIIDTWNMKVIDEQRVEPGRFLYRTNLSYTALQLTVTRESI